MANISRYDPFDELFRGFFVRPVEFGAENQTPQIRIDVKEQPELYVVHAEIPGVNKDEISVNIDGAMVAISAERKMEKEVKEGERVLRTERHFGKVSRSFQLGQDIDEANATAKYTDGVLELRLPKKAPVSAKRLTIN